MMEQERPAPPEDAVTDAAPAEDSPREELERTRAQLQRAMADYQNLERRSREERGEVGRIALAGVVSGFLPVLDDLERAVEAGRAGGESGPLLDGVDLVLQKFRATLEQYGVREILALGEGFDPAKHEATGAAPGPEGQVVHLVRRGYQLHDRVVRPAMVMVGSGEASMTAATAAEDETDGALTGAE
jgi:molecular chaperone GrpE